MEYVGVGESEREVAERVELVVVSTVELAAPAVWASSVIPARSLAGVVLWFGPFLGTAAMENGLEWKKLLNICWGPTFVRPSANM